MGWLCHVRTSLNIVGLPIRLRFRQSPSHRQGMYLSRAGAFKSLGAFINGRACCKNVIDEENALALDGGGIGHKKGIFYVLKTFLPIQPRLRLGPMFSHQRIEVNAKTDATAQSLGEQSRLIEASLPQSLDVERNRQDELDLMRALAFESDCKELYKGRNPVELGSEF